MSFRIEKKFLIHKKNISFLYKFLEKWKFFILHPNREIFSYYFDNNFNQMHIESEEGLTPRKKIRLRWYNHMQPEKEIFFEKKINSVEGRFKTSNLISNKEYEKLLNEGYFDKVYGNCKLKMLVNYKRSYYSNNEIRLTLDENINYCRGLFSNIKFKDDENLILEIKYQNINYKPEIFYTLPATEVRSSKYCNAINFFQNKNYFKNFDKKIKKIDKITAAITS